MAVRKDSEEAQIVAVEVTYQWEKTMHELTDDPHILALVSTYGNAIRQSTRLMRYN